MLIESLLMVGLGVGGAVCTDASVKTPGSGWSGELNAVCGLEDGMGDLQF